MFLIDWALFILNLQREILYSANYIYVMAITNQAPHLDDVTFQQLATLLQTLPSSTSLREINQAVANVSSTVYITAGVHYNQFDPVGPYHFNIRIGNGGYTRHVYVTPTLITVPNHGINVSNTGSVTLSCPAYWVYQFLTVT